MADRHRFGQSPPPLVEYLQDILNRYPDGGQILKELIQNAEDAEASEVRFLYDRTQYGAQTLHSPKLTPYQGPALCAYNDACFTEDDWNNIQNTARSVKKGDPMKIGRFGLGFNSVYHLTDLPMILSGQHVAILDPHESIFRIDGLRQSGRIWHLKEDAEEIKSLQDQFSPFKKLFDSTEDPFETGSFNGTIFRFPLRQTPSRLSKTLYDYQKVVDLFDSFKADGDIVLLFMHHVRSIKLMTRETTGHSATDYRVSLSSKSEQEKENRFTTKVREARGVSWEDRETVVSTCRFSMAIDGGPTRDWLVTNYVKGRGISEEAIKLSEELSLLPWVGVAMPLSEEEEFAGRTFCCLPLPAGHESTGLPVHVHGFFGVSDNRRSLKWTGTDQKSDSAARWNELLVQEILPAAYARLITDATKCCTQDTLYAALPDRSHAAPEWDKALTPFFDDALTQKVVWTPTNGGKWIAPEDAVFNRTSVPTAVLDYLVGAGIDVVTLPKHVMQAIDDTFDRQSLKEVTPGLLRATLKKTGVHNNSREHKLTWLQYALDDEKYDEMEGIELLPLADKTFTTFNNNKTIFIESEEHPRTLLPGLEGRFLDMDTDNQDILLHMRAAATEAEEKARSSHPCLQLRHLSPQLVATHLREALPPDWLQVSHVTWDAARAQQPPEEWLAQLWQYLQVHFPNDLSPFVGLPLLPTVGMNATSLVRLEQPSKVMRPRYDETNIPDVIKKLARDVDATVLEDVPPYLNHPKLEEFIHRCTPSGLLGLFLVVGTDKVIPQVNALSPETKKILRAFFAKCDNLLDTGRELLTKLPIFEAVDDTTLKPRYLAALDPEGKMRRIAPDLSADPLPEGLFFPTTLIVTKDLESQTLGHLVRLQQLSTAQLLTEMVEKVRCEDYTREQTDSLMLWILKNLHTLKTKDPGIIDRIQTLAFVTTNNNSKVTPAELFSPEEAVSDVLLGEPVFPAPPYTDKITLTALLELGMRQKLSAQDILHGAESVQTFYASDVLTLSDAKRKAVAIISVLLHDHEMLTTRVKGALLTAALMDVNFLPVFSERPRSYLPGLSWYPEANSATIFVSPKDARDLQCAELVGATMPIVDGEISDGIISAFGWDKNKLPIEKVVGQLKMVCDHYEGSKRPAKHHFVQILTEIYQHIDARLSAGDKTAMQLLSSDDFPPWVWQGDGLAAPKTVALTSPFNLILDLAPYRFILPEEFRDFKQMFKDAGVKESFDKSDLVQTHPDILEEVRDDILVPIATKDSSRLTLAPVSECTYNDVSWSDAQDILDDEDEEFKPLHKLITLDAAQLLEAPSLSQRVVNAEEFGFDQCGQHEKVTQRLKNILNDYPEGAGIFKELIQNADDAGATEVKFLVDWRTNEDSKENLIDQGMAVCHGPALWAFNDAAFSEEDFKNIQNLGGQTKLEALEKVGRFGVGFNSVYHLTDVPSFVSGSRVLFFDPHATHLSKHIKDKSRPGIGLDLKKNIRLTGRCKDQFKPFQGVFGYSTNTSYNGTLFRLPLRTPQEASESEISDVVYSKPGNANMERLIESFEEGLKPLLLFTQNVRHVTMYTLDEFSDPSSMIETFDVSKSPVKYLREMQSPLHSNRLTDKFQIQSNCLLATSGVMKLNRQGTDKAAEHLVTSMVVKVTCRQGKDNAMSDEWIISSCMGTGTSLKLALSESGRKAGLVPCGGVAALLKSGDDSHQDAFIDNPLNGEVFCFLPLSVRTGLPVHVNGSFAVASNRRGLWEETSTDRNDLKVEWNKALMEDAVCKAYARLITDATQCCTKDTLYAMLPDRNHTDPDWDKALTPFLDEVLDQKVVWTPANDGKWITPKDAVFNRTSVPTAVLDYLVGAGIDVVTLPKHVMQAIDDTFDRQSLKEVTPGLLRATLKKTGVHNNSREHKLTWLQYALDDEKYDEMEGIELLPLADKTFTTFNNNKTIFIESEEHPRTLLPGLEGRFLDMDTDNQDILLHMRAAATEAEEKARSSHPCLQLRHLSPQLVATHLREALPPDWLQSLRRLPLLPTVGMNATSLVRLEQPSKVMRPRYDETNIPDVIKKLARDVDATVLEDVPPYLNHPKLEEFIHRCTPSGLLGLFLVVGTDKVIPQVNALSPETKKILRAFFAKCDNLLDTGRELLTKLPIFEAVDDTTLKPRYLAALDPEGKMRRIAPDLSADPLPEGLFFPTTLIVTKDLESQTLGHLVRLQQLSTAQLLTEMVEKVRCEDYTREQTDSLMLWILKNLHTLKTKDPGIIDRIQTLAFVTTNNNSKVTPAELFSPEEAVSDVLLGEPDILHGAESVQTFYASDVLTLSDAKRKAVAIISVLLHDHEMLTTRVKGALLTAALMDVNFLPVFSERPRSYLPGLSWYPEANSATIFVSPKDARDLQCAELVGATMPIVDGEISDGIISAFGWEKNKLPIEKVVGQLKMVCDHYEGSKRPAKHHFVQILTEIYQHIDARLSAGDKTAMQLLSSDDFPPWVWQGDGLAAPKTVALTSPFNLILDLAPYRFILPEEFRDFKQMFKDAGVKESFDKSDLVQTLHEIQSAPKMSVERDLKLSVDIIGWLVSHPDILEEVRDDILVPIATKDSSRLTLAPVSECTYNDVSWSDAQDILDDEDEEFKPLHKLITLDAAQLLEAPSLSQRVVNAEEFGFDQCGQHEKVTQRLKNILNDYPEGAGIFKELVQNADDAGATEVKFLVDWRTNEDSKENLIDQGMAVCHGPALWAFNDAAFSEEDFKNIQNLGGQTKLEALEKVGRFGVGFNSVYHLTDVPSFVSGSRVLFFDPHATHLSKHIKDKSRPGIGLDLKKNIRLTGRCKDQFKPFQGVFGYSTNTSYNGTLFRLPLRTPQEASESEISDVVYSKPGNANMERLIESFEEGLKPLLLFTQNVRHVTMYTLDEFSDPSSMIETFDVSKSPVKYLREMQSPLHSNRLTDKFQIQSNCLLATSGVMKLNRQGTDKAAEHAETSMVVKVTCRQGKDNAMSDEWIISSCMGTETSLKLALSESGRKAGLVPCGGVAALLKSCDDNHQNAFIDNPLNGEVFCFLPLSVRTGLPVHVNGSFAVASNRRGLWEETSTDKNDLKVEWNKALMEDAVCKAYARLITDATQCCTKDTLYAMLPDRNHTDPDWDKALTPFLDEVLAQKVVWTPANDGKWITPKDAVFNRTSVPTAVSRLPGRRGNRCGDAAQTAHAGNRRHFRPPVSQRSHPWTAESNLEEDWSAQQFQRAQADLAAVRLDEGSMTRWKDRILPLADKTFTIRSTTTRRSSSNLKSIPEPSSWSRGAFPEIGHDINLPCTIYGRLQQRQREKCAELVGSTMPIVNGEMSDGFISAFGWDKNKLPIDKVVGQLKMGDGLAAPKIVALTSPFNLILDLAPYRFILPEEFRDFKQMFKDAGVKESFDKSDLVQTLHEIQSAPKMSVERDLKLSVDIIGWLVSHQDILEKVRDDILVPIATKDSSRLTLAPVSECTYNDVSWSDAQDILDDEDEKFKPLHKLITLDVAQLLEVPSLSQRVVNAEEFGFDQCGQHEKVTQRLKNILNDYPEGAGIFKELVQNADDAGATEVKFLVDWRTNEDSKENLIDQGMAVCHGPALWAFNDAAFSEEDFKNIQNLGGQTKLEALEKVGRFGVGFNSVYHLTDVPSFVSGSRVLFFDPHATHLSKHIKDKSRPGIGLDLKKNTRLTGRCKDQFKPFQGVFGYSTNTSYNGTLFRLPLRTPQEASESEISDVVYSKPGNANMERLIESFKEGLKPLLLFTQNVRHVAMYTLDEFSDLSSMIETFDVSKSPVEYLREMQSPLHSNRLTDKFQIQSNCLLATSGVMKLNRQGTDKAAEHAETSMVVKVTCRQGKDNAMSEEWIISSCMGTETSLKLALSESGRKAGLVPCGGVAALLKSCDDNHQNAFIDNPLNGEVFCFLPLSVRTGLPVHVNGSFAVESNRRGLWEETSTDKNDLKVEWNKALMEDAVCKAYVTMLLDLSTMAKEGQLNPYQYHSFWPNPCPIPDNTHYSVLLKAFYAALSSGHKPPPLFEFEAKWLSFTSTVFLDPEISFSSDENVAARCALQQCCSDNTVVELPEWASQGFEEAGCGELLSKHTYTEERFYSELFFPRIHELSEEIRDPLMLRILSKESEDYHEVIETTACIPASPRGQELNCPGDLVHPNGKISAMFLPEDKKFPHGSKDTYLKPSRLEVLTELGMCKDDVSWEVVIERAESVVDLNKVDQTESRKRIVALLDFIVDKTKKERNKKQLEEARKNLSTIPFLPIMQKPPEWPFEWKGSEYPADALLSALDLQPSKNHDIAGVSNPILCSRIVTGKGKHNNRYTVPVSLNRFLGLEDKSPDLSETLTNLMAIVAVDMETLSKEELECTRTSYLKTCQHLQKLCHGSKENENEIATRLFKTPFIMSQVKKKFLLPSDVSFDLKFTCAPYLYRVPEELATELTPLFLACKVKTAFEACDFIRALDHLKEDKGNQILSSNEVNLAQDLLKAASDLKGENIKEHSLWIPDQDGVLRRPSEVCYNDCAWIEQKDDMVFCHKVISRDLAVDKLGVKPVRHKALEAYSHSLTCFGTDFGQVEKLTNRIKNLLDAYPFGKEILKELLQNADDAGATEIHFVYDKRQHDTKHIFDDSWKELQGPALCVYNNRPFTEKDLIGIQSLGEGSKTHDPVKTGKYGVGFNAVYHLTDCPSFMTGGDTLCVFDPQLRFVPGARLECPGRMYRGIDDYFRQQYKDVFDCYLKDKPAFSSPESTMFRFPLRTAMMATDSDLSDEEVTEEVIMDLLGRFKSESFEVLLFLNSVEKIKISVIESDGTSHEFYHAEALISEKAKQDRRKFADCVAECAQSKKSLHVLPTHHVTYNLDLRDNSQHKETWIVHQRIGFEDKDIPNSIKEAHSAKELGLLPRGGAAVCHKDCKQPYKAKAFRESKRYEKCDHMGPKRAFCFLPLPIETKLPVHVNGHFALDHEARRNLWRDEKGGMKSDWNKTLINEVIAPAYAAVLDAKRAADFGVQQRSFSASKVRDVRRSLDTYHNLFPSVSKTTDEWRGLSLAFYRYSDRKQIRLLPLLRSTVDDRKPHDDQPGNQRNLQMALEWLPPTGAGKEEAFFNTLKYEDAGSRESHKKPKRQVLIESLLGLGFNLLVSPTTILDDFQEAEVEVKEIKPESVIDFLQTYATDDPLCRIGASLPVQLSSTTFKKPENLQVVLHYCLSTRKRQEESKEHTSRGHSLPVPSEPKQEHEHALHGLPLLLTQDNILRAFDVSCPVFATDYAKLVPRVPDMFVHNLCVSDLLHKKTDNSVRSFDISALSELMPRVLDKLEYGNGKAVKLSPTAPPQDWICCIWQFLDREVHRMAAGQEAGQKSAIDEVIALFADWAILPAVTPKPRPKFQQQGISMHSRVATIQPGDRYLVPLCKAHTVVNFNNANIQQDMVAEFLRKIHCLELDTDCLRASSHFAQLPIPLVPLLTNHVGILRVLHFILVEQGGATSLDTNEATELLKYFEDEAVKYTHEPTHLRMLRSLPLYKTIHNKLISLTTPSQCHVLPVGIPTADMDDWIKRSNAVFLEKNSKLEKLHKTLGCSGIKEADVYQRYIFPNMDHLSDDAVQVHLDYLRKILYGAYTIEEHTRESLLGSLRDLRVIPSQVGRRPVGEFYDDTHDVFHEMVSDENFLPECYRKEMWKWRQFFIDIGLINKVTKAMFLEYAREVERLAKVTRSEESRLKEKSNVLVKHFFEIEKLSEGTFIEEVSGIRFIVPANAQGALVELHSQYGVTGDVLPFVCFKDSVSEDEQELCWTRANLLPRSVTQEFRYYRKDPDGLTDSILRRRLRIQEQPSIDTITSHVTCLCQHLAQQKVTETEDGANSPTACKSLWEVMRKVYAFLCKTTSDDASLKDKLVNVPCIVVENGRRLVRPEQIAINLEADDEIRPYLYSMPMELGEYNKLFVSLGAPEKPTPMQYAKVLEEFYALSRGEPLDPNEKVGTHRAVYGMFHSLRPESIINFGGGRPSQTRDIEDALQDVRCLYLPSRKKRLQKSTDLVFDDTPHFINRVKEGFHYPILVPLKDCHLFDDEQELISRLPTQLRPKYLSSLVQEQLCDGDEQTACVMGNNCVLESKLTSLFLSTHFSQAIVRLCKHTHGDRCDEKKVAETVGKFVSTVKVCCKQHLTSHLVYTESHEQIKGSDGKSFCFIEDNTLYVAHTDSTSKRFQWKLTRVINNGLGRPLADLLPLMIILTVDDPSYISRELDMADIKRYTSGQQNDSSLPTLGTPIPEMYHHLLKSNPAHFFTPGNYVGFEVYDPDESDSEEEYTMSFLYAQVIKEASTDTELKFGLGRKYVINVGHTKTVSAADLYKFCRPNVAGPLVLYEGETDEEGTSTVKPPQSLEDAMEEVSNILEEAWKLPEKERKKVVRRLYLQWHPDKNPDNVELATEVCKHIQAELSRLEKGLPRKSRGEGGSASGGFDFGESSFSSSFNRWNSHARFHSQQRERFYEHYRGNDFSGWRTGSGQWVPPRSDGDGFPNPREAARWHRQATADLQAARDSLSGPGSNFEWTCLMCHQAVEKALKAVQLGKFGKYEMIHQIGSMARVTEARCGGELAGVGDAAMELSSIGSYPGCDDVYLRARYPNFHPAPGVPNDMFTRQHAERAIHLAHTILDMTQKVLS
ncbi:SACS [Branchiostoma lanceolatum]|uniref:SACS protein n=1 Tax=Branchiostoma lanceolatum TaxID=7740 RepID=A0A8K0E931_BRALA|nr:SACS [Branchiostoma lanceolatum]